MDDGVDLVLSCIDNGQGLKNVTGKTSEGLEETFSNLAVRLYPSYDSYLCAQQV